MINSFEEAIYEVNLKELNSIKLEKKEANSFRH